MSRVFVDWSLVEEELIQSVPTLGGLEAIAADVQRFADSPEGREVEQAGDAHATFRLAVAGRRVVTMYRDSLTRSFLVLNVRLEPNPDAELDDDPGEYEDP